VAASAVYREGTWTGKRAETRSRPRRGASIFAIIGIVVAFGTLLAGFLVEKGQIMVLSQPV